MDNQPIDNSLDQLQAERLAAETARLQAQEAVIRDRLNTPWYERTAAFNLTKAIAQALFTVMVGVPIVWFYMQNVIEPASRKENLELKADSLEQEIQVLNDRRDLNNRIDELQTDRKDLNKKINELQASLQQSQASITKYQTDLEATQAKLAETQGQISRSESSVQQITTQLKQQNLPSEVIEQVETVSSELEQTTQAITSLQDTVTNQETQAEKVQEEISKNLETKVQTPEHVTPAAP